MGIARYVRDAEDPQAAEIAVTIVEDWRGRGLGTGSLAQLAGRARQEGVRRVTVMVAAGDAAMASLMRNMSAKLVRRRRGTVEYEITLAPGEEYQGPGKVMKLGRDLRCRNCRDVPGVSESGGRGPGGTMEALTLTVVCHEGTPARSCHLPP